MHRKTGIQKGKIERKREVVNVSAVDGHGSRDSSASIPFPAATSTSTATSTALLSDLWSAAGVSVEEERENDEHRL